MAKRPEFLLQNVLLDASWSVAKLADVGLARVMDSATGLSQQHGCTFAYAAPEVLLNQRVTIAADIYSFGELALRWLFA